MQFFPIDEMQLFCEIGDSKVGVETEDLGDPYMPSSKECTFYRFGAN